MSMRPLTYGFDSASELVSVFICNCARSIIGVRCTVRDHFNVQTGFRKNY